MTELCKIDGWARRTQVKHVSGEKKSVLPIGHAIWKHPSSSRRGSTRNVYAGERNGRPLLVIFMALVVVLGGTMIWSSIRKYLYCPWCWERFGIGRWYPRPWSSTVCIYHEKRLRAHIAARRARRAEHCATPSQHTLARCA